MNILTRAIPRTRTVAYAPFPGADTEFIDETYDVHVPRDWDRIVLGAVAAGTALILALAIAWSTAAIGDLLALGGVFAPIAYGVACVFNLSWILCMGLEWLARYEPAKAAAPRKAGYAALAVDMTAVCLDGIRSGDKTGAAVGIIGAAVSLIAKLVWSLAIRHTAQPLTPRDQQWVTQRQGAAGAELAMAVVNRQLLRSRAHLAAHRAALALDPAADWSDPDPDRPTGQSAPLSAEVDTAIRAALATMPGASPEDVSAALAGARYEVSPDTVRTVSGQQDSRSGSVSHIAPHAPGETITDTVRRAVRNGLDKPEHVLAAVRRVHGHNVNPDSVTRLLNRVAPKRASG